MCLHCLICRSASAHYRTPPPSEKRPRLTETIRAYPRHDIGGLERNVEREQGRLSWSRTEFAAGQAFGIGSDSRRPRRDSTRLRTTKDPVLSSLGSSRLSTCVRSRQSCPAVRPARTPPLYSTEPLPAPSTTWRLGPRAALDPSAHTACVGARRRAQSSLADN